MSYLTHVEHDEMPRRIRDGRLLASLALGFAIAGIALPIFMTMAALLTAAVAKRRMPDSDDYVPSRKLASSAQLLAVFDFFAQAFFAVMIWVVLLN